MMMNDAMIKNDMIVIISYIIMKVKKEISEFDYNNYFVHIRMFN